MLIQVGASGVTINKVNLNMHKELIPKSHIIDLRIKETPGYLRIVDRY